MNWYKIAHALCVVPAAVACAAMLVLLTRDPSVRIIRPDIPALHADPDVRPDSISQLLAQAAAKWPFRESRSSPASDAATVAAADAALQQPRPQLQLAGVVHAREASAVVAGLPGAATAQVIQIGQSVGGVTLRKVMGETATLSGYDTTWHLTLVRPE